MKSRPTSGAAQQRVSSRSAMLTESSTCQPSVTYPLKGAGSGPRSGNAAVTSSRVAMRRRIYTDTSAVGGCFDVEFQHGSIPLFDAFRSGAAVLVVSDLTLAELEAAPEPVRDVLLSVPVEHVEFVSFSEEAAHLSEAYLNEGVVPSKSRIDAQHIATATICRADVLVSWNFKHIVNLERIHGYNSVNLRLGYPMLEIRSPMEVLNYDD